MFDSRHRVRHRLQRAMRACSAAGNASEAVRGLEGLERETSCRAPRRDSTNAATAGSENRSDGRPRRSDCGAPARGWDVVAWGGRREHARRVLNAARINERLLIRAQQLPELQCVDVPEHQVCLAAAATASGKSVSNEKLRTPAL